MKRSMFKVAVLFLLMSATYIRCVGQEIKPIELGLKAGLNISNLYTIDNSISDMIFGFNAGLSLKLPVNHLIAIQPELYITTKGGIIRYNNLLLKGTANFNLTYLELPVLGVIKVSEHINFQLGPFVSFLLDAKATNMNTIYNYNFEQNLNINNYNRFDVGVAAGAEIVVHSITMGIRYNYGFVKDGKEKIYIGTSYTTIPNATNGIISFYMSISLLSNADDRYKPISNNN